MKPLALPRHSPAPAFRVHDPDGEIASQKDYRFRRDLLLFFLHGPACSFCAEIAREMRGHRQDWEKWETELLVVQSQAGARLDAPGRVVRDVTGEAQRLFGAAAEIAFAVIDHRGRFMEGASLEHPQPVDWREVAETVKWVAVQEPECGACEVLPGWGAE